MTMISTINWFVLKHIALNNCNYYCIALPVILFAAAPFVLLSGIENMTMLNTWWSAMSMITITFMGIVLFKDKLSSIDKISLTLVIAATLLPLAALCYDYCRK